MLASMDWLEAELLGPLPEAAHAGPPGKDEGPAATYRTYGPEMGHREREGSMNNSKVQQSQKSMMRYKHWKQPRSLNTFSYGHR